VSVIVAPLPAREPVGPSPIPAILGLGVALPERVVANAEVGPAAGVDDSWIRRRTGISARRRAGEGETATTLATSATLAALADAGVAAAEVDLVVAATMTPDFATPQVAPLVASAVGATGAGAFDVAAACTGWLSALGVAAALIEGGRATRAVVVGVDVLSRVLDFGDRVTAPLFGDGAGAAVLGAGDGSIGPVVLGSDGAAAELITCPLGGRIAMDGQATFRRAVDAMAAVAEEACARAGLALDEVDLVIPHQANSRIISAVGERLGLGPERVLDVIAETGNTSAATLPIALAHAASDGRLNAGDRVLLVAFGAGLTWGGALLEWGSAR
jgi:3-oxoacyl-[acyl-carrier-protein] synthase III